MPEIDKLVRFHDRSLGQTGGSDLPEGLIDGLTASAALTSAIAQNHQCNIGLSQEEDQARRHDVPAERIVASKRRIDSLNQQRNDAVEAIAEALIEQLSERPSPHGARLHSETPGAMIDRLSILALKIFHMHAQLQRTDADATHLARCSEKLHRLRVQRRELAGCLRALLDELQAGTACFHVYRQFKMYNDPALNPWLGRLATTKKLSN